MDGAHEIDRILEVGTEEQEVAAALGDGIKDRLEVGCRQRISGLKNDAEVVFVGVCLGA